VSSPPEKASITFLISGMGRVVEAEKKAILSVHAGQSQ